ncbi:MAG: methylenetetrahydrofolate dehydrogenase (NADP+) / methenyltetrahydrofolate cyclohydrolase [Candidatus Berkelbacteria bacterium Licking1014_2]|uniref:Methylenetetrahydrofolate dehydrogenase (NADP+) / methenyltetrahydrofolate cyclohydrolase n=1 Tax=Candidatus Berkelbacteria bacterium Licking1014_2 TaxID=2017146 RepID=A0A554LW50_9BACT|nr:MAG: methylenetetrahydrofolate dehydrogenase (NADP+) / methenyltetrahydrofolate cyclohydrolase [Candidatus Berkelbacteria bacterium Licking1014_2]
MRVNGQEIAEKIYHQVKLISPAGLAVILVGDDKKSVIYTRQKEKTCQRLGIYFELKQLSTDNNQQSIIKVIRELNKNPKITAIIVQLPLPEGIDADRAIAAIDPAKNVEKESPAAAAVMAILDALDKNWRQKKICLVGCGRLIGQPLRDKFRDGKINDCVICDINTRDIEVYTKKADVIILATGQQKWFSESMIKRGAIVIDAGLGEIKDESEMERKAKIISPRMNGVGPVTVAMLIKNILTFP